MHTLINHRDLSEIIKQCIVFLHSLVKKIIVTLKRRISVKSRYHFFLVNRRE